MKKQNNISTGIKATRVRRLLTVCVAFVFCTSCSKQVVKPVNKSCESVQNFNLSESKVILLEGNATRLAISFRWDAVTDANATYVLEAAVGGSLFADPIEIASTSQTVFGFTVKDFNTAMCKLLYANNTGMVDFRLRVGQDGSNGPSARYSSPVCLSVTTYQPYIAYDDAQTFKIPGNYQNWNITTAPKIVPAVNTGEYEGYINFTNQYPQVLMVKGTNTNWDPMSTYTYIGADKFGFGGSMMSVFGGAGIYLFRASTNTNTWSYTKINSFGITGTAVPCNNAADLPLQNDNGSISWTITTDLVKGSFRFRANGSNTISFGQKATDNIGVPSYDGDNICIKTAGNYTIKLQLGLAGNYAYSIVKNN
jgi:hypothetical protein